MKTGEKISLFFEELPKMFLASVAIVIPTTFLFTIGINQLNRSYYESKDKDFSYVSITKPDLFGTTQFTRVKREKDIEDRVYKYNWFSDSKSYVDWDSDGLVEKISKGYLDIKRDSDFDRVDKIGNKIIDYKEEFKKADKILAETKERFKEHLK